MGSKNREVERDLAERTRARLERISEIPALPPVLLRVWDLTAREDTSAADLGREMSSDPGLTGTLLRLANSAYLGFPRQVSTVTQAIVILGFETVKSLALGASVFRALNARGRIGIDAREFLRHSLAVAMAARILMERVDEQKLGTVFAAGILHDVGKLVIAEFLGDATTRVRERVETGCSLDSAERETIGLTHAEIGFWFANRWKFPSELADAVRWHHEPASSALHRDHASAVHLGDVIAHRAGAGGAGRTVAPEPSPRALSELALSESELRGLVERVSESAAAAEGAAVTLGM